jgi:hypothetical protein
MNERFDRIRDYSPGMVTSRRVGGQQKIVSGRVHQIAPPEGAEVPVFEANLFRGGNQAQAAPKPTHNKHQSSRSKSPRANVPERTPVLLLRVNM